MAESLKRMEPIRTEVMGEPVEAHGYIVTPVAHVSGRLGSSSDKRASGRWGWIAVRPLKMTVSGPNGQVEEITLVNAQAQALTGMIAVGLLVALVSLLVPVLSRSKMNAVKQPGS